MPVVALDRIDRRMLAVLQREGRISNVELAERVNLSPSPCLRRLQRLEKAGVITGYAAQVDPHAVGLGLSAFLRVQLGRHDADTVRKFADAVRGWDEVVACHALTGDMDYLMHIVVEDLDHYAEFLMGKLLNASGVADLNSSFVLQTVKQTRELPLGQLDPKPKAARARKPAATTRKRATARPAAR
jgi:Lrp/AsnC family transcriptional regulator, leucine-responsive regulatory protein